MTEHARPSLVTEGTWNGSATQTDRETDSHCSRRSDSYESGTAIMLFTYHTVKLLSSRICPEEFLFSGLQMESAAPPVPQYLHAADAMDMLTRQPSPTMSAAAASQYFAQRAAAAGGNPGLIRTDMQHLSELERKLMEARQRFQDLKEEKCNVNMKGCGCWCCPHGFVRARDQRATSIGPDSRSFSETSNLPAKKATGSRQHLTRSVKSLSTSQDTTGAEHGSLPNSEGLLLAVDKFLSMK